VSIGTGELQLVPTGIRGKPGNNAPVLVAITQTCILGKSHLKMTIKKIAKFQEIPGWYISYDPANLQS